MNFFSNDLVKGVANMMSNNGWGGGGSQKQNLLRSNLQRCTYPDETKWMIQKAVKQIFHVYPFFTPDILMFTQNGMPRRYIELKGILEIDIKGKICKVDFNMMLPSDYPRSPPFVRIVNRNPDYIVDPFYQSLKSKTDPTSYIMNEKLTSVKGWMPSSSLVNVVIQCYDTFKGRFPFSKPVIDNGLGGNSPWDALYTSKKPTNNNNTGGNNWGGSNNNNNGSWGTTTNNNWANQPNTSNNTAWNANTNSWGNNNNNNNSWGNSNSNGWGANNNNTNTWGTNNNNWTNPNPPSNNTWGNNNNNSWGTGGIGGMSGIIGGGSNVTGTIASAQKLVGKQKQSLTQLNVPYLKAIEKIQILDITKQSLESQENYLRKQNYEMSNFLKENESSQITSISSIVQPKDAVSEQILDLMSGIKARQQCALFIQNKFNQEQMSLQQFLKQIRKIEEAKFQQKFILYKCLKRSKQ